MDANHQTQNIVLTSLCFIGVVMNNKMSRVTFLSDVSVCLSDDDVKSMGVWQGTYERSVLPYLPAHPPRDIDIPKGAIRPEILLI